MRRIKIMGLCLVAVCAMSVAVVSSASAAPEYFSKGAPIIKAFAYKNTSTKPAKLLGGLEIECQTDTGAGKIKAPNVTEKLKVTYKECVGIVGGKPVACQKAPTKPGVIVTEALKGALVLASETKGGPTSITNHLEPEKAGHPQAKFTCGTLKVEVHGTVLAQPLPISVESNTATSTNEIKATEAEPGCTTQKFLYINGTGPCEHLFTASGLSENVSNDTVKYSPATTKIEIHP
jgi:hypothetical protein